MSEEAVLLVVTNDHDEDGFPIEKVEEIPVYVKEKSVRYTEFYDALRTGYTPKIILEMRQEDWAQSRRVDADGRVTYATQIMYDDEKFDVIRTYKKDRAMIQITCG